MTKHELIDDGTDRRDAKAQPVEAVGGTVATIPSR